MSIIDRKFGGKMTNSTQLYYENITCANIIQNTDLGSLATNLIVAAL